MRASISDRTSEEFLKYYEQCKTPIFTYLLYRVRFDREVAEDLTSEVFIKAFEHFDSFDRARSFKTWIFTIAHNHLVNFYVSRKEVTSLDEAIHVTRDEVSVGDSVDTRSSISRVLSLVNKLSDAQRELVIMRYVNDLSYNEIASITGKAEGAIRTAISRALSSLRTIYSQHYPEKPSYEPARSL